MGRKSNGEGSIYFVEKEQKWRAEINWIDSSGKIRRKCWKDKKQSEVKTKLTEFKKQLLLNNIPDTPENRKFREFADEWMITTQKPRLKPLSYSRKATTLAHQVYPLIGGIQVSKLTHSQIQKMVNELNARGLSYSTTKKAYEAVSSCLRYYRIKTSTSHNICEGIVLPEAKKKQDSDIKFFNETERKKIVAEATREYSNGTRVYRLGWVFVLMMYTGMRIGELCALTWNDIDFKNKTININKNAITISERDANGKNVSKVITQNSTKTSSGTRIIPMTEKAFVALTELNKITGRFEHITTSANGRRIIPTRLNRTFYKILDAAGLRRAGCHTLRHTFATMLFSNGCEVKIVSELLGHSNTKITENIYIHLIQQQKVKAIASIDKYSD